MSNTKKSPKYRKEKEADDLEKAGKKVRSRIARLNKEIEKKYAEIADIKEACKHMWIHGNGWDTETYCNNCGEFL